MLAMTLIGWWGFPKYILCFKAVTFSAKCCERLPFSLHFANQCTHVIILRRWRYQWALHGVSEVGLQKKASSLSRYGGNGVISKHLLKCICLVLSALPCTCLLSMKMRRNVDILVCQVVLHSLMSDFELFQIKS